MDNTARLRVGVLLILIVVALASSLWAVWYTGDWGGLVLNFGTEMAGALVTYALLELFIGSRERREAEKKELEAKKADLIAQMGSRVQDVAIAAAEELTRHGWLTDGSLIEADLKRANLERADLRGADLEGANLEGANLRRARLGGRYYRRSLHGEHGLRRADLQGAHLRLANLQGAHLVRANLRRADLEGANLEGANLYGADLRGANLEGASLEGAKLERAWLEMAQLSEDSILPDGTKWTPDTDMARLTDPNHPDFWRPGAQ